MKLKSPGKSISKVEVLNISNHGIWLSINEKEYFLPYENYSWFKKARLEEIYNIKFTNGHHLYWPDLDVDLELDCIANPAKYPLSYK